MINETVNKYLTEGKGFSDKQIESLRKEWGSLKKIDPTSASYKKLAKFIDNMNVDQLKGLAFAKIKWLSMMAGFTLKIKHKIELDYEDYLSKHDFDEQP
jgi:hypothetical protein